MKLNKNLKYPIKYTVMPIEQQISWSPGLNELKREYEVVVHIVSKCYVIGERKEYDKDGNLKIKYEVVFPYSKEEFEYYGQFRPSVPEYNIYSQCINSVFVEQLFNHFEEALVVAEKANNTILAEQKYYASCDRFEAIKQKYLKILSKYKMIEEKIEKETQHFQVTQTYCFHLGDLIEKILKQPSDFYIALANELSFEERKYLKELIKNRSCANCANGCCRIENWEKVGLDQNGYPQGSGCTSWENDELVGKQLILMKR